MKTTNTGSHRLLDKLHSRLDRGRKSLGNAQHYKLKQESLELHARASTLIFDGYC
jgi:hypothetical protein